VCDSPPVAVSTVRGTGSAFSRRRPVSTDLPSLDFDLLECAEGMGVRSDAPKLTECDLHDIISDITFDGD
jgi:hypothetical protein